MVPMRMRQKKMGFLDIIFDKFIPIIAYTCSRIHNKTIVTSFNFNAARVTTVFHVVGRCTGNTAPHSPKFYAYCHYVSLKSRCDERTDLLYVFFNLYQ